MIKKLTLENFKNFKHAELELGPFTLLVGANATGKSNIREAFRFLHGIGRGYTIPDIIGEKWVEGGVRVWNGIRGGLREIVYSQPVANDPFDPPLPPPVANYSFDPFDPSLPPSAFLFNVDFNIHSNAVEQNMLYRIEVNPFPELLKPSAPIVENETLVLDSKQIYQVSRELSGSSWKLTVGDVGWSDHSGFNTPMLSQIKDRWFEWDTMTSGEIQDNSIVKMFREADRFADMALDQFKSARFFEFTPDMMRVPSLPGQNTLGDQGENLSSVLHAICQDEQKKLILIEWLRELTPMDATDFEFTPDQIGRILVTIVEKDGRKTSAYSASDGTLRFLGILAALLGPETAQLYFFEEIENGIHPNRLHLLLELIEQVTSEGHIQVIATTHSPQLLGMVSEQTLDNASLTYRLEGEFDAHIQRIIDIPNAREVFKEEDLSRLYERGWLENSVHFLKNGKEPA